jgi:hypothetical protein
MVWGFAGGKIPAVGVVLVGVVGVGVLGVVRFLTDTTNRPDRQISRRRCRSSTRSVNDPGFEGAMNETTTRRARAARFDARVTQRLATSSWTTAVVEPTRLPGRTSTLTRALVRTIGS